MNIRMPTLGGPLTYSTPWFQTEITECLDKYGYGTGKFKATMFEKTYHMEIQEYELKEYDTFVNSNLTALIAEVIGIQNATEEKFKNLFV